MKKLIVPTPYGGLQFQTRHIGDVVIATIGGAIETPNRHPSVLGETISLDYWLDPSTGWFRTDIMGRPWAETPAMTISSTTREIVDVVEGWLRDHRDDVRTFLLATFETEAVRLRRKVAKVIELAAAELRSEEEFLERVGQWRSLTS